MEKISIARRCQESRVLPIEANNLPPSPSVANAVTPFHSLESLITEGVNDFLSGEKRFYVEITSGQEKPLKVVVIIQPLDTDFSQRDFYTLSSKNDFFTVKEAAHALRVSEKTLYRQLKQGNLSGLKVGRQWRVFLTSKLEG